MFRIGRKYSEEKPYVLEPGKHYICEISEHSVDWDNVRYVVAELERADIHLHVIIGLGNTQALDMKVVRSEGIK